MAYIAFQLGRAMIGRFFAGINSFVAGMTFVAIHRRVFKIAGNVAGDAGNVRMFFLERKTGQIMIKIVFGTGKQIKRAY